MQWLPREDYMEVGLGLAEGHQVRINHEVTDCHGGSNSLKIERKDNGDISAYCFRCGRRGYHRVAPSLASLKARASASESSTSANRHVLEIEPRCEREIARWSVPARAWIRKGRLTDEEVEHYGLCYDAVDDRVIIPQYDADGDLVGFQGRRISDGGSGPKYLTKRDASNCVPFIIDDNCVCPSRRIVIVEDFLSGVRVGRFIPTLVLSGVKIHPYQIKHLMVAGYEEFVVWLDDDNAQVKKAQLQIKRSLDKVGKCLIYHGNGVDPKELSDDEIKEILSEVTF